MGDMHLSAFLTKAPVGLHQATPNMRLAIKKKKFPYMLNWFYARISNLFQSISDGKLRGEIIICLSCLGFFLGSKDVNYTV